MPDDNESRFKSFHSPPPPASAPEITFELEGTKFTCRGEIPNGALYLDLSRKLAKGNVSAVDAIFELFDAAMDPAELLRFRDYINDPGRYIATETIGDLFSWLWSEYAGGRPTQPSGRSQPGSAQTKPTLVANSSTEASG